MAIPTPFIQDLIARSDIVQIIGDRIALKKAGASHKACCPFHQEKTPSFVVSESRQTYHCFGCGEHGNVIGFLMAYDNMEFLQAIDYLASIHGMEVPQDKHQGPKIDQDLYTVLQQASDYYQKQLRNSPEAIDYLKNRGFNGQIAKQFAIGFAPEGWRNLQSEINGVTAKQQLIDTGMLIQKEDNSYDRFRHRIMIPIRDTRGRVIAFGGRALSDDNPPKYLNSPETPLFHKSRELFGLYEARMANHGDLPRALICEGYMDVIALYQYGINYAMATLGTACTSQHIHKILRYTKDIVFCFDGDRAGREAAWKALLTCLPLMHDGICVSFIFLPETEDPDSYVRRHGTNMFERQVTEAQPLSSFFFKHVLHGEQLDTVDNRASFGAKAMALIKQIKPGIYQDLMKKQLGELLNYDVRDIDTIPTPPPMPKKTGNRQTPSLTRKAIMLLLNNPEYASQLPEFTAQDPGQTVLLQLIQTYQQDPNRRIGVLVSQFEPKVQDLLLSLSEANIEIPKAEQITELKAIVAGFAETKTSEIDALMQKARQTGLNDKEKQRLQALLLTQAGV